jgi:hypothetical protein
MGSKTLDPLYKAVEKDLGAKAKMPKERGDLDKARADVDKAYATFAASRDKLEDDILAVENAFSALFNTMKQNNEVFSKDDFGLNAKDKDDAKKIKNAQGLFTKSIGAWLKGAEKTEKEIDELDKHCIAMGKYKSPKTDL